MNDEASLSDDSLRIAVIGACREISLRGLGYGTSGNVGIRRDAQHFFVSPTGMAYDLLEPADVPLVELNGRWFGRCRPSSEWRFHRDIFKARSDVAAIVHTHSPYAAALACTRRAIPAFHYMVAMAGGVSIRCAPYHTFGTQELSDAVVEALEGRRACLLANHGVIALGANVAAALSLAGEVENLAKQYAAALAIGEVEILDDAEMRRVIEKFRTYGTQHAIDVGLTNGGEALPSAQPA